jgi:hypothetical protein
MEECLRYFRQAIERPGSVAPWGEWWRDHEESVRQSFDRPDDLRLKFRTPEAARSILERRGRPAYPISPDSPLAWSHCPVCGEKLMRFVPNEEVSRDEDVAFGTKAGVAQCRQGYWLHPGVYCPNRCTWVMAEFYSLSDLMRRPS